tara:strand:+ start:4752 stop:5024 length:273 start_codon:yes stop_codon:yes gene_type:complete
MKGFGPGFSGYSGEYQYHGMPIPTDPNAAHYRDRPGLDWGKVRLNFSYDDPQMADDNVVYLDQGRAEIPWMWIYTGGIIGLLGLVYIIRR